MTFVRKLHDGWAIVRDFIVLPARYPSKHDALEAIADLEDEEEDSR